MTLFGFVGILNDGYYESKDYIRSLEYDLLDNEELDRIHAVELKRTNNNLEVDIIQCIYVQDGDEYSYFLFSPNQSIINVSKGDIVKLAILGYGIEKKSIPGVIYPRRFKVGVPTSKNLSYKFFKSFIPSKIIRYDLEQFKAVK